MATVEWACVTALSIVTSIQFLPITTLLAFYFVRSVSGVVTAISCIPAIRKSERKFPKVYER